MYVCNVQVPFEVACSNQMRKILVAARPVRAQPVARESGGGAEVNCMICMDQPINTIILPCGHQVRCREEHGEDRKAVLAC